MPVSGSAWLPIHFTRLWDWFALVIWLLILPEEKKVGPAVDVNL